MHAGAITVRGYGQLIVQAVVVVLKDNMQAVDRVISLESATNDRK